MLLGINTSVEAYRGLKTILERFRAYSFIGVQTSITRSIQIRLD